MTNSQPPIPEKYVPFLQKVMTQAKLPDIYDARDITVVVFSYHARFNDHRCS